MLRAKHCIDNFLTDSVQ